MQGGEILDESGGVGNAGYRAVIRNCLLNNISEPVPFVGATAPGAEIYFDLNGSGNENYRTQHFGHWGQSVEETSVTRVGGATYDGTNLYSIRMIPNGNTTALYQYYCKTLSTQFVSDYTSAKTFTVEFVLVDTAGTPTKLTDQEIYMEIIYPDDLTAQGLKINNFVSDITGSATDRTDSTETWNNVGTFFARQKMSVTTDTSGLKGKNGPVSIFIHVARDLSSGTTSLYVDPKVVIS